MQGLCWGAESESCATYGVWAADWATFTHIHSGGTRNKNGSEAPGTDLDGSKRDTLKWSPGCQILCALTEGKVFWWGIRQQRRVRKKSYCTFQGKQLAEVPTIARKKKLIFLVSVFGYLGKMEKNGNIQKGNSGWKCIWKPTFPGCTGDEL